MNFGIHRTGSAWRRGFTIVELLMVIGIISVLIGISVSAISGSMTRARGQRANALCTLVAQGIQTYYAQNDEWPVEPGGNLDKDGHYAYTGKEVREMVRKLVEETKNGNPVMDVTGLYVISEQSQQNGEPDPKARGSGTDFMSAVRGTKKNPSGIPLRSMYFGYQRESDGAFRRFVIKYLPQTDSILVRQVTSSEDKYKTVLPESEKNKE